MRIQVAAFVLFALAAFLSLDGPLYARETLTVTLRSGRKFTAAVDHRTDEARLWLRFGEEPAVVLRPIAWEAVAAAWRAGQPIPLEQLRQTAEVMKTPGDQEADLAPGEPAESETTHEEMEPPHPILSHLDPLVPPVAPRVASVGFDAYLANWDADAQPEGLALLVRPLDKWGRPVAAAGSVQVELAGAVRRDFNAAPQSGGTVVETLDQWTKSLAAALPTADGYLLKLPFGGEPPSPEYVASRGRVHLRLVVPGQGVLEAVSDGVPIRPYAPLAESRPGQK